MMKLRTLPIVALLLAVSVITIVVMYVASRKAHSPSVASSSPVRSETPAPRPVAHEREEAVVEEEPVDAESIAVEWLFEEESVGEYSGEPEAALESIAKPNNSESVSPPPAVQGQVSEEEIAKAFDLLGRMLGLPEVSAEELKRKVEEVGKLRFRRDVPIDFMSREELSSYIHDLFEAEYPPEVGEREERALRALGLLEAGQDLRNIRARVLNENIAGFYDERPDVRRLFAISSGRKLNLMNQLILSHELRHALQDQYLNLRSVLGDMSDYDDRKLAALSLIEGDATLLMERYMTSGQAEGGTGLESLLEGFGSGAMDSGALAEMFAGPELRNAPPVVREQLLVPYLQGRRLAGEIHRKGGFRLLNERLRRLPRSMEQVLHPAKYLDRIDEPIDISLIETHGNETESEGRVGELFVRTLFESTLPKEEGIEAAAGWGGDRYALWKDEEDRYHLLWRTVWDTDRDAREFFDALTRFASVRFGQDPAPSKYAELVDLKGQDGSISRVIRRGREVVLEREGFR